MTFSGDKLLGGPQAGVIAGRADLVAACSAHPLARALRPGALVLGALQDVLLAYLRRDAGTTVPFWRMAGLPADVLGARAGAIVTALGERAVPLGALTTAVESLPGAGSLPGTVIPSFGIALDGDRTAELRAADRPVVARVREGRTYLDLRTVDPGDDATLTKVLATLPPACS